MFRPRSGNSKPRKSTSGAPTIVLHIAECQALLGRLVDASETYNTLAKWKIDPDKDPPLFVASAATGRRRSDERESAHPDRSPSP